MVYPWIFRCFIVVCFSGHLSQNVSGLLSGHVTVEATGGGLNIVQGDRFYLNCSVQIRLNKDADINIDHVRQIEWCQIRDGTDYSKCGTDTRYQLSYCSVHDRTIPCPDQPNHYNIPVKNASKIHNGNYWCLVHVSLELKDTGVVVEPRFYSNMLQVNVIESSTVASPKPSTSQLNIRSTSASAFQRPTGIGIRYTQSTNATTEDKAGMPFTLRAQNTALDTNNRHVTWPLGVAITVTVIIIVLLLAFILFRIRKHQRRVNRKGFENVVEYSPSHESDSLLPVRSSMPIQNDDSESLPDPQFRMHITPSLNTPKEQVRCISHRGKDVREMPLDPRFRMHFIPSLNTPKEQVRRTAHHGNHCFERMHDQPHSVPSRLTSEEPMTSVEKNQLTFSSVTGTGTSDSSSFDCVEVQQNQVVMAETLGRGCFSETFKGEYKSENNPVRVVAVKRAIDTGDGYTLFQRDAANILNKCLTVHENILQYLGHCTQGSPILIMDFASKGSLHKHLRLCAEREMRTSLLHIDFLMFARQIINGMKHLADSAIIHCNLSARNIMMGHGNVCKVSDYGFKRSISQEHGRFFPVRWMSPETLQKEEFTLASDVWSFGIVLYEMVTLGKEPYENLKREEVKNKVTNGHIMGKPEHCEDNIYRIMCQCWCPLPNDRPTFHRLGSQFENIRYTQVADHETSMPSQTDQSITERKVFGASASLNY